MLASLTFSANQSIADLVSPYGGETAPNFVELSVQPDHVRVTLEVDLNDYPIFVIPDDGSGTSLAERTGRNLQIWADEEELTGTTNTIDVRPRISRQTAASALYRPRPRSENVVFVDMEFPFNGKPERVTFIPPLSPDGIPLASLGVVVEHMGVPVTDYRYLSQAETMLPDWDDPWFSKFENPNLTRHHKSPMMSFLAMEPRVVRHEIILRLTDFETWADLDFEGAERLTSDDVARIKSDVSDFFATRNPLTVDGKPMKPETVQVSRIEVGAEGLRVLPDESEANRKTMLLGVVLSYPVATLPKQVDLAWELFADGLDVIPITLSDPAGAVPSQIYASDPVVSWNNHLTTWINPQTSPVVVKVSGVTQVPSLAFGLGFLCLVCAYYSSQRANGQRLILLGLTGAFGAAAIVTYSLNNLSTAPEPDEIATHQIVEGLLTNIGTTMLETRDDNTVAAMEPYVEAINREKVQAEMRRGLSVTLPSGALARVEAISDLNVESFSPGTDRHQHQALANWTARVSGGHWGHLHRQTVSYRGLLDVSRHGDHWMLDDLTIISAKTGG
ncbi:hypothetical protein [Roseibium sp. RKSG952]|uniref:hypothetical protein n=1 Tax=Roseibium sp. RKSG952 TaxID=2529384 RepID=UPI0012BD062E|nr:hypothetical protein [Roseibium sp. RKSG952]MTI02100.1 hypothetical protein [Roseibium sp. RKSG952]